MIDKSKVKEDLTGRKFGKWEVLEYLGSGNWLCICGCEHKTKRIHKTSTLTSGMTKKCKECSTVKVNESYFDIIDTPEKAYVLGFITADGCNYEKEGRFKIDLSIDDLKIIEEIKLLIGHDGEIKIYKQEDKIFGDKSYKAKDQARLLVSNRHMSEQLKDKGCMANKSKFLKFPDSSKVPEILYSHYFRGYFDGNGHVGYWIDNPRTGHKKFNMTITSTVDFANKIAEYTGEKFKCKPDVRSRFKERDNNNATVAWCGNRVIENILNWIYKDSTIHLDRKYNKYLELLEQNK